MGGDVLPALDGVLQGVRLGRVLLGLHQQPALVLGVGQDLKDGIEVDVPVPGHGEGPVADGGQEAPIVVPGFLHHGKAHILHKWNGKFGIILDINLN